MDETQVTQRLNDPCIFLYNKGIQLRDIKVKEMDKQRKL